MPNRQVMNGGDYPYYPAAAQRTVQAEPAKQETIMTKCMKSQFSFFGIASAVYAIFYTFCLYKNASGITHPFFVIGTLCYFFLSMKRLGVPYKKDSLFYMISIVLLGISNCCTDSLPILWMNKLCIFGLLFILILHTVYEDKGWTVPKYLGAVLAAAHPSPKARDNLVHSALFNIYNPLPKPACRRTHKRYTYNKNSETGCMGQP